MALELAALEPGTRIRLKDHVVAEVTTNPRDGMWVFGRVVESSDPGRVGSEDMICLYDIAAVIGSSANGPQ